MISPPEDIKSIKNLFWALPVVIGLSWLGFAASFGLSLQISLILLISVICLSLAKALYINLTRRYDANYCLLLSAYLVTMIITPVLRLFIEAVFGTSYSLGIYTLILSLYFVLLLSLSYWHWRKLKSIPDIYEKKFQWENLLINTQNKTWRVNAKAPVATTSLAPAAIGSLSVVAFSLLKFLFSQDSMVIIAFLLIHIGCLFLVIFLAKKIALALRIRDWQNINGINLIHASLYQKSTH